VWRAGLFLLGGAAIVACSSPKSTSNHPYSSAAGAPRLWGDLKPVVSVRELMKFMIDPMADQIFKAVGTTVTKRGIVDIAPTTEEAWGRVRIGAVSLAEGASLLKIPRPFTPPGDDNNSVGPGAVELSPTAIAAKVARDPVEWNARIEALRNVALEALDVVGRKDVAELWDVGENLDKACEACHRSYWYPGESAEFYRRLRGRFQRVDELPRHDAAGRKP
jgi:hypothetical protein